MFPTLENCEAEKTHPSHNPSPLNWCLTTNDSLNSRSFEPFLLVQHLVFCEKDKTLLRQRLDRMKRQTMRRYLHFKMATALFQLGMAALAPSGFAADPPRPAPADVRNVTNNYFGTEVVDPYRWMEDWKSPEFKSWLKAENEFARAALDGLPARTELLVELRRLDSSLNTFPSALNPVGQKLFYMQTPPPTDVFQLFMKDGEGAPERLLFDPQKLASADGAHHSLDLYHAAPDGKHVVCRVSRGGSEETVIHVVSTGSGKTVGQPIEHAESGNSSWHPNGRAFFYKRLPLAGENITATSQVPRPRVYMHYLDSVPTNDRPVFGFGVSTKVPLTERQSVSVQTSWDSDYIIGIVREGVSRHCDVYVRVASN